MLRANRMTPAGGWGGNKGASLSRSGGPEIPTMGACMSGSIAARSIAISPGVPTLTDDTGLGADLVRAGEACAGDGRWPAIHKGNLVFQSWMPTAIVIGAGFRPQGA